MATAVVLIPQGDHRSLLCSIIPCVLNFVLEIASNDLIEPISVSVTAVVCSWFKSSYISLSVFKKYSDPSTWLYYLVCLVVNG